MAHMHYNAAQHKEQRMRDEGRHAKHLKADGSVPIVGRDGARIHGAHSGEMHPTHGGFLPANSREGMMTPAQGSGPKMKKGKPGDHEENA